MQIQSREQSFPSISGALTSNTILKLQELVLTPQLQTIKSQIFSPSHQKYLKQTPKGEGEDNYPTFGT